MTNVYPALALAYNREVRAARRRARFALAFKLLIAMALTLTVCAGITAAFRQIIVIQMTFDPDWHG